MSNAGKELLSAGQEWYNRQRKIDSIDEMIYTGEDVKRRGIAMLLNLAMVKDKLPSSRILQSRVRKESPRNLKQVRFYEKDQTLSPDILYLASAEDLPVTPEAEQISLLCLGKMKWNFSAFGARSRVSLSFRQFWIFSIIMKPLTAVSRI